MAKVIATEEEYTLAKFAKDYDINEQVLRRAARRGTLTARLQGKTYVAYDSDVQTWLKRPDHHILSSAYQWQRLNLFLDNRNDNVYNSQHRT